MNIGLLYGGVSYERAISISSADSIYKSIKNIYKNIYKIDFSGDYVNLLEQIYSDNIDIILNVLHGGEGENGELQKFLEFNKIKYTGSNFIASSVAMNKNKTKELCINNMLPTPKWNYYNFEANKIQIDYLEIYKKFFPKCVVKPSNEGSSIGMYIIDLNKNNYEPVLKKNISNVLKISKHIIIEEYIPGRELTASILDNEVLPIIEIIPKSKNYDYNSKYTKGLTEYIVPAKIEEDTESKIKEYALHLHKIIGCRHYSRVDFRLNSENEIFILELNTLPGMTATSLFPKAAKKKNISYKKLIQKIIKLGLND